jgi:hypothetical protein
MTFRAFALGCFLTGLAAACSSSSSGGGGGEDGGGNSSGGGGNCTGQAPSGSTCQKPGGGCEALVCEGTSWTCPTGDMQVALTATSCQGDGGSGGDASSSGGDAGCTGSAPAGATCQKAGGGCEALVCQGSTWACPSGDTQVALTATSCAGEGGAGGDSGSD